MATEIPSEDKIRSAFSAVRQDIADINEKTIIHDRRLQTASESAADAKAAAMKHADAVSKEVDKKVATIEKRMKDLEATIEKRQEKAEQQQEKVAKDLNDKLEVFNLDLLTLNKNIGFIKTKNEQNERNVEILDSSIQNANRKVSAWQREARRVTRLKLELRSKLRDTNRLHERVKRIAKTYVTKKEVENLQGKLEQKAAELSVEAEQAEKHIKASRRAIRDAQKEIRVLKDISEKNSSNIRESNKELSTIKGRVDPYQRQIDTISKILADANSRLGTVQSETADSKKKIAKLQKKLR